MEQENRNQNDSVFSRKIRAGRRRTYFFDVRTTKASDYYLTITESKKRNDNNGYERHKVFIYKEDFNKFLAELTEAVNYIKEQMPDFDFDSFNHVYEQDDNQGDTRNFGNQHAETSEPEMQKSAEPESNTEDEQKSESGSDTPPSDDHEDLKW